MRFVSAFFLFVFLLSASPPDGEAVYKKRCAACHEQTSERIPPRSALQKMPSGRILRALDSGAMLAVALTISRPDRIAVADYLGVHTSVEGPAASAFCRDRTITLDLAHSWNGWSPGSNNARFQPSDVAGLSLDQVRRLKLKWAFGFDGDVTAFAPPTVIGNHVFVGSAAGLIHAMRADSGCLDWVFQAKGPVRSSVVAAAIGPKQALLFGDMVGWFYAIEAETGKLLWNTHVEEHDSTRLTGGAAVHDGVVYVPVASWEETRGADPDYPCCTFRGSVVALRLIDGSQLWKTYMTGVPKETVRNSRGVPLMGPSGVGVWSRPTTDPKRRVVYVTTGDNYSLPATNLSDSVVALEMKSGLVVWSKQFTKDDRYNSSCIGSKINCPGDAGPDFDFGSSAILLRGADGHDTLLAGQKSGIVYALDPDKKGEILWQTRVGIGGTDGGVQWGMATDGERVFAAVSDVGRKPPSNPLDIRRYVLDPKIGGGVTALRVSDGSKVWHTPGLPCPDDAPSGCSPSQPGAVTEIPGVVFVTSTNGHFTAQSTEDGRVLWDFDTMREFKTVNGVKARGGSIDGPGAVVVNGMVFVNSGYPRNGGVPGNVLLAFGPE